VNKCTVPINNPKTTDTAYTRLAATRGATLNDPYLHFKSTPLFDVHFISDTTRKRDNYNGILIGTYTQPSQRCNFE